MSYKKFVKKNGEKDTASLDLNEVKKAFEEEFGECSDEQVEEFVEILKEDAKKAGINVIKENDDSNQEKF